MTKVFSALTVLGTMVLLSLPAGAVDRQNGIRKLDQYEFSSRHRGWRHQRVSRLHYYDSYPWWWHPPYVGRVRTYYLPWPYAERSPDYDRPYPSGVVGFSIFGPYW